MYLTSTTFWSTFESTFLQKLPLYYWSQEADDTLKILSNVGHINKSVGPKTLKNHPQLIDVWFKQTDYR